ncbi:TonB-dependent receptor [Henriciella aquimarina]|uniref:TonB-dependent receptor n=1 Tax=Henriciella aquimarina TaxID=545261 RepID=UPI0009FEE600|nr:TonB-dependent receptor [Henriciella aquimarina]
MTKTPSATCTSRFSGTALRLALLGATSLSLFAGDIAWAQTSNGDAEPAARASADTDAETEADARLRRLGVVTVSARRREESLKDAPVAITAVSSETLDQYAVTDFTDIATLVPNLVMGRAASGSSSNIFLRGVGSSTLNAGFDQSVSINIDGLPMSRGREIGLSQYDIEQVEVLKGPQALFFGKNATGGLISVTTKDPTDTFEAGIKGGYGFEAEEYYGEGFISGPLTDTLKARFAFRYSDREGPFENTAAQTYLNPLGFERHRNSEKRGFKEDLSGRLTVQWEPSDVFDLELKLGASSTEDGGPTDLIERICGGGRTTPATANGIPPSPNADCRIDGRSDSSTIPVEVANANYRYTKSDGSMYADLDSKFGILTGAANLGAIEATSITSYYEFKQTDQNNVAGEAYPSTFTQLADFNQWSEELRFQTQFDGPLNFLFGGFLSESEFIFNTDAYIFPVPIDPATQTYTTFKRDNGFDASTYSVFAEGTWSFLPKWELAAGARWSRDERDSYQESLPAHSAFAAAFPAGIRLDDDFSDENISPQVTLRYQPTSNISLYGAYKEGFKSGGFNISQTLTPASSVEAGEYDSETAKGFEAGIRSVLFDGSLSFNATVYDYLYEDLQVQKFDPVTVGQIVDNAGELSTTGAEFDFTYIPDALEGLTLRGALAYNKAEYADYIGQCYGGQTIAQGCDELFNADTGAYTSQDYNGRTPPKAPEWAGRVGGTYEFPVSGNLKAQISTDVSYSSEYNFTDTLRPDAVQDAYAKWDAAFRLINDQQGWEVALIGKNLTDELVANTANDIPFSGGTGTGTTSGVVSDMSTFIENPMEVFLEFQLHF